MISDPTLWVECDRCQERIEFDFSRILGADDQPPGWKGLELFMGWDIQWDSPSGLVRCPKCKDEG